MASLFYLLLSFCTFIILYCAYTMYQVSYWQKRGVPCEKPLPFFGNFKRVFLRKCNAFTLIRDFYEKFEEPYFGVQLLNKNILILKDPKLIKNVLMKDFNVFDERDIPNVEKIDPIAHNTLFSAKKPKWKGIRSKVSPLFTSGKIKLMFHLMKSCGEDMESYIEENQGKAFDVKDICSRYTCDVITSCAFGLNANSFKSANPQFYSCGRRIFADTLKNSFSQFCYFFLPLFVHIFKLKFFDAKAVKFLSRAFWNTVEKRKRSNSQRNDLIDLMNVIKDNAADGDCELDDHVMVSLAIGFFSAGQDSTSTLISFILYELALQPDIQKRLRKEIDDTKRKKGGITYDGINDMKYLDMVVHEGLRKYPSSPLLNRKAMQNYKIETTGLVVEKGTQIIVPLGCLHYDKKYFPEPERFVPERFSTENKSNIASGSYMPFGNGPRSCIGLRFALISAKVCLVYIVETFEIGTCAETQIPIRFNQNSHFLRAERGINLKFTKCNC